MDPNRPWQTYHTVFTNAKAGMDGVDKEKVQKVVYEMSKGSKYFDNEQRREASILQRIQQMQAQATLLTEAELANYEKVADMKLTALEAQRNLSRIWMHVDLDAFYAAVETLEDPSLAGKPMAVGGMSMICTANYEARKFGIRAAMPGFIACKLCPDLIFVPPNFKKYTEYSNKVRQVFREYDPHFLPRSLDEAYLDITEQCTQRNMSSEAIAEELRRSVLDRTGLTCSAGVGPNRMIAKVCSDINKPNGQYVIPNQRAAVIAFVSTLPIRKVSGIGKVTEKILKEVCGVSVCEDLLKKRALIMGLFSSLSSEFFLSVGLGIGGSDTPVEEPRKSLSCERTFPAINSEDRLLAKLEEIADSLSNDMKLEGLQGRTLTLKLKTTKFEVRTRSVTLSFFVHTKEDLMFHSSKLLKAELPVSLRLMGLRVSHFHGESIGLNQKTLSAYFPSDNKLTCIKTENVQDMEKPQLEMSNSSDGTMSNKSLSPRVTNEQQDCVDTQWGHLFTEIDEITNSCASGNPALCEASSADVDVNNYDKALECSSLNSFTWTDDRCSLCKLEIPSYFMEERQEHMDFHFAEMLQQEYANAGVSLLPTNSNSSKRSLGSTNKNPLPKKGRVQKAESLKENKSSLPMEAFFPKSSVGDSNADH